jgi:putative colanic acid biosynthesis acetyltransferase WcaF
MATIQDLKSFSLPAGFRGRPAWLVQLWWIVQATLFGLSPQFMYRWRRFLLRAFGARLGNGVLIRPSVRVTYPWKLRIGDNSWIGDGVLLYTLGDIEIGENSVISQYSRLMAGSHDYSSSSFDIYASPIVIGSEVWISSDVFVAPGVTIGRGAVIGARSSVFKDMPESMICYGYPAKPIRTRSRS